ncbi:HD domain-containing protein [Desulfuribacillus alkaliarsenatis]|uniref:Uncharacterized protein n=1 Tax=Desulfuribacillus alkaliarsenatis TaxID=766136 RepID=A0A1E5G572_9FIRM|nr:HD domain-containing protein [Desulfuribacillus alkaliarsenatis]OEF98269.1 hypothetical protein BHF68_00870 [Desulfuribacillus alkaliarsenatis]
MAAIGQRIKQLAWALTAHYKGIDEFQVCKQLNNQEQELFFAMSKPDQYHAFRVYETVLQHLEKDRNLSELEIQLLKKAALLHDVGRIKGEFTIAHKVLAVIIDRYIQKKPSAERQDIINRVITRRRPYFLYIYYKHPILSKQRLEQIGSHPLLIFLTEHHHSNLPVQQLIADVQIACEDKHTWQQLLTILRSADEQN